MDKIITVTVETQDNAISVTIYANGDAECEVTRGEMTIEQMSSLLQQIVNVLPS